MVKKKDKWRSIQCKHANNIYSAKIIKWIKGAVLADPAEHLMFDSTALLLTSKLTTTDNKQNIQICTSIHKN